MTRTRLASTLCAAGLAVLAAGCGTLQIGVPKDSPDYRAAVLFNQYCAGCHSLDAAAAKGSAPPREAGGGERTNGPNFNQRPEDREAVLYAIRNGGYSGAIMPANILVGEDAEAVADFVAKYAGKQPRPNP